MGDARELLILGAGDFALEVTDLAYDLSWRVIGYAVSIEPWARGDRLNNRPVWWVDELPNLLGQSSFIGAMVSPLRLNFLMSCEGFGCNFIRIIHPSASISSTAKIGKGVVVNRGVTISAHAEIEDHVVVNRGALIGHHVKIEKCATIGPGANLAGRVHIKQQAFIGMGAQILEGRKVEQGSVVGAGAVVTKDVPSDTIVKGMPAKKWIRFLSHEI